MIIIGERTSEDAERSRVTCLVSADTAKRIALFVRRGQFQQPAVREFGRRLQRHI